MKTLATCALSIALCLGGMTTLAIRSLGLKSTSSSELHMAASAAFQDGVYLGKLAAESGREMRIAIGRWPSEDRLMFTAGYRRATTRALPAAAVKLPRRGAGNKFCGTGLAAGRAKLMFACQPCRGIAILLTLLFSTSI